MRKLKSISKYFLWVGITIFLAEGGLRWASNLPQGIFSFERAQGLFPPNRVLEMKWGFKHYQVKTNRYGFRGEDFSFKKQKHTTRIVAMGDSATDGFFVNNEQTYPHFLEQILRSKGHSVEVINAASGAASIGREFGILKEHVLPLRPDFVILTFVTNDISEIQGKSKEALLRTKLDLSPIRKVRQWVLTRTAIGEGLFSLYLDWLKKNQPLVEENEQPTKIIAGNKEFRNNAVEFLRRFGRTDGMILGESFTQKTWQTIETYFYMLKQFHRLCSQNNIKLIMAYFPAYSEIYDPQAPMAFRLLLKSRLASWSVPLLDLTESFQNDKKQEPLHFAPIDFHPNADGNRLMAEAIAAFLKSHGLGEGSENVS